ncbi:uncharacterized protein Dwil_GK12348 [Drosophila willistoni]|uniref:Uncharacterized protein n=1 Tax=Drosophila willistoni TaxID=7260 RepID=B4N4K2_DROWI|nr:uncharacterized protein LOC6645246 [Drosophila willistoni]EDW79076.1 uncharacterized protein Dwil_GK12348 [Drosophila willistoni]
MSESTDINITNSQSHLIEVHHVGVTAKLQSPLKNFLPMPRQSTSSDSEIFPAQAKMTNYHVFENEGELGERSTECTTVSSNSQHVLYEMQAHAAPKERPFKCQPHRIEFQRYHRKKLPHMIIPPRRKSHSKLKSNKASEKVASGQTAGYWARLVATLDNMCKCTPPKTKGHMNIIDDLPEPHWNKKEAVRHTCIGIYPFEHGCADYLSTTDTHPKINSIIIADRATTYATHFWAELFGLLHIGVAFIVAFILQFYRFILYSLVNSLIVGLLHMTSDYMIKPILTVIFNGYLQPPMIFLYNILCSMRDILEPVAETLNNFMKPLATVGGSLRLINVNYRQEKGHSNKV